MIKFIIIISIILVFCIGFVSLYRRCQRTVEKLVFADVYRNKFIEFVETYFSCRNQWDDSKNFDGELYTWLTMNVGKMQNNLGRMGICEYTAAFQYYKITNYQIVINSLPKFRDGTIGDFDVHLVDDCLLRYIGFLENRNKEQNKELKNPIIWFRAGVQEILSIPILILNWFGIINSGAINSIKTNLIYKFVTGLVALIGFLSAVVTIIIGYEQTITVLTKILK